MSERNVRDLYNICIDSQSSWGTKKKREKKEGRKEEEKRINRFILHSTEGWETQHHASSRFSVHKELPGSQRGPASWSTEVLVHRDPASWSTEILLPGSQRSCLSVHRKLIYYYMFTWQKHWGRRIQVSLTRTLIPHKRSPFSGPSYLPVSNASVWRLASDYEFWQTEIGTAFIRQHLYQIPW